MWHGCRAPIRSRQHSAPLIPAARGREANPDGGGREANPGGGGANPVDPRWIRLVGMMSSSSLLSFLSSMPTQLPDSSRERRIYIMYSDRSSPAC
ncbi:hypothetical protein BDA96_01G282700 [Sorghum bicolor]|uniref:Uncharacterized protein n=1 Tax=Sorghum bicolor TaxID=4558 RepID=A0A921S078_SORBI|nr:hypothetical protein BDA96_01G282700 [Sorghum bicolor]